MLFLCSNIKFLCFLCSCNKKIICFSRKSSKRASRARNLFIQLPLERAHSDAQVEGHTGVVPGRGSRGDAVARPGLLAGPGLLLRLVLRLRVRPGREPRLLGGRPHLRGLLLLRGLPARAALPRAPRLRRGAADPRGRRAPGGPAGVPPAGGGCARFPSEPSSRAASASGESLQTRAAKTRDISPRWVPIGPRCHGFSYKKWRPCLRVYNTYMHKQGDNIKTRLCTLVRILCCFYVRT